MATRAKKTTAPEDPDEVNLGTDEEAVVAAAKASFSLEKRLQGMTLATAKVLLFTDLEAARLWQEQDVRVQRLAAFVASKTAGSPEHADALEAHNDADDLLEELRDAAFGSALAVHMRAVPQVAVEAAQRKARTKFRNEAGQVSEEDREAFLEFQNELLLGQVVTRIVDGSGAEAQFTRARLATLLRNSLPVPQYGRLVAAFNQLMFNDTLGRAATADPGF